MVTNTAKYSEQITETLQHLDPHTLLLDRNITDRDADETLIASVHEHGVLTPARGILTEDGKVRLRYGYRRAAACMATDRLLPVIVAQTSGQADDPEAAAAALDRLAVQWAENEHREGLSATDKVAAVAQMALLGLSSEQIAARTHTSPAYTAAAVAVAASEVARHALAKTPDLDLTQVAVLAEFEDDLDAAQRLYAAAQSSSGRFAHVAATERENRAMALGKRAALAVLAERGIPVIERPSWQDKPTPLTRLRQDGARITPAEHRACPGRAVYLTNAWTVIDGPERMDLSALAEEEVEQADEQADEQDGQQDGQAEAQEAGESVDDEDDEDDEDDDERQRLQVWALTWACTDPEAHGHTDPTRSPSRTTTSSTSPVDAEAEKAAQRAERRRVIANNTAWRVAEPVRRDWIRSTLLSRKTAPKGAAAFIATVAAQHASVLGHHNANSLSGDLMGGASLPSGRWHAGAAKAAAALAKTTEARALVIALGTCVAACEANTDRNHWRSEDPTTRLLLTALAGWGYERSDVERLACGDQPTAAEAADAAAGDGADQAPALDDAQDDLHDRQSDGQPADGQAPAAA